MMNKSAWQIANENRHLLTFSTYFMANEFERYLETDEAIDEAIRVCKGYGIPRIYLETFRNGFQPSRSVVAHARDRLRKAGFEVAAAICTIKYGEPSNVMAVFPCLSHERTHKELSDMFTFAASLFDTILIDEYIWSHCQCEKCNTLKGERTWTEFRCDQLRQVCREFVIKPARETNPDVQLIYKFPATYEQFARQGQDIDFALEDFDGIWIGTEIGPFAESPHNMLQSQGPYRAFFLMRWMLEMGRDKTGGAWIMPLEDSSHFRDTAYQTILGGPSELVLHPYGGLSPKYNWVFPGGKGQFPDLLENLPEFFKLAKIVKENQARGLVAARPARAEPWDLGRAYETNVFDYIGQLGIPLRPTRDFPEDAEGFFLSLHTRSLPGYKDKIEKLRHSSLPILVTDGLASLLDERFLNRPNVHMIEASVSTPPPTLADYRDYIQDYISMQYTGDSQMARKIFGIAPTLLEKIRVELLRPFDLTLRGPIRVSIYPLGQDYVVLHNFNEDAVKMWIKSEQGKDPELVVTLPRTSHTEIEWNNGGFEVKIEPHTLTCLRFYEKLSL